MITIFIFDGPLWGDEWKGRRAQSLACAEDPTCLGAPLLTQKWPRFEQWLQWNIYMARPELDICSAFFCICGQGSESSCPWYHEFIGGRLWSYSGPENNKAHFSEWLIDALAVDCVCATFLKMWQKKLIIWTDFVYVCATFWHLWQIILN